MEKLVLKKRSHIKQLVLSPVDNQRLAELCGKFDENLRQIERHLGVEINSRGNQFQIIGFEDLTKKAADVLLKLYEQTTTPNSITPEKIHLLLQTTVHQDTDQQVQKNLDDMAIQTQYALIKPRNLNQYRYIKRIQNHDVNFGIGPAGTGKTYLAVACAVAALERDQVQRIVLVRPAVEAGEKLGFLPGDLAEKVNPYLRPLYDALYEMMGINTVFKLIEKSVIEIAPLAYMRGRTLNDAFIILDESQNTTKEQMKMFLTRIGFNSKAVITGDITQVDLPKHVESGLRHAIQVLSDVEDIQFTFFQATDVVRHNLVQRIIQAYEKAEQ